MEWETPEFVEFHWRVKSAATLTRNCPWQFLRRRET